MTKKASPSKEIASKSKVRLAAERRRNGKIVDKSGGNGKIVSVDFNDKHGSAYDKIIELRHELGSLEVEINTIKKEAATTLQNEVKSFKDELLREVDEEVALLQEEKVKEYNEAIRVKLSPLESEYLKIQREADILDKRLVAMLLCDEITKLGAFSSDEKTDD